LGAKKVVLTDMDAVFELLDSNVVANRCLLDESKQSQMIAKRLDWKTLPLPSLLNDDDDDDQKSFDIILAADCIYVHAPLESLINVLKHYSTPNVTKVLVTCEEHEPTSLQKFLQLAKQSEFSISHLIEKNVEKNQRVHLFQLILQ
jgi:predicted nicotinamide N-methyase